MGASSTTSLKYVDVLLPVPLDRAEYTYILESEVENDPRGVYVKVPFGRGQFLTGIVTKVHDGCPDPSLRYRKIVERVGSDRLPQVIYRLWKWVAEYYMCSIGEVYRAAVPGGFRPNTEEGRSVTSRMGWVPDSRIVTDEVYYESVKEGLVRSKTTLRVVEEIRQRMLRAGVKNEGDNPYNPSTLKRWGEYFKVSSATIKKLKDVGAIVEVETNLHAKDLSLTSPRLDKDIVSATLSKVTIDKRVTVIHTQGMNLMESLPLHLMREVCTQGGQVLLLLSHSDWMEEASPLIAGHLNTYYKPYTSAHSEAERVGVWQEASSGTPGVYAGLRATIWLPLSDLRLVVVMDEESRNYKQYEPAPRFNAVHVAMVLAQLCKASTILVSATPSIETMLKVAGGEYGYHQVEKGEKVDIVREFISLSESFKKNKVRARLLSFEMIDAIRLTLNRGGRALLYYHRKGYARQMVCEQCGDTPLCEICHIPMRYFEQSQKLVCPLCGSTQTPYRVCTRCHEGAMVAEGTGIERLKEEVIKLFPTAHVGMDNSDEAFTDALDIVLSSSYYPTRSILKDKSMVGIVRADLLASIPDFRGNERLYAFLIHCERMSEKIHHMVVQYLSESINAIEAYQMSDYRMLFDHEVEGRHMVAFPPFSRMLEIYVEGQDPVALYHLASQIGNALQSNISDINVLGPAPLPVRKKHASAGYKLAIFHPLDVSYKQVHRDVRSVVHAILGGKSPEAHIYYEVDPT